MKSHRTKADNDLLLMIYSSASIVANRCYLHAQWQISYFFKCRICSSRFSASSLEYSLFGSCSTNM
jgi:hypothetical protein